MASTPGKSDRARRSCPRCGAALAADDDFCTHCGERVDDPSGEASVTPIRAGVEQGSEVPVAEAAGGGMRRWPWAVGMLVAVALAVAAGVLAGRYRDDLQATQAALATTEERLARAEAAQAALADELEASKELSEKRAVVLRRANGVLGGIDPLLSSVDELKGVTGQIQAARDDFLEASDELTGSLIDLANELIDAGGDVDEDALNEAVDDINAQIDRAQRLANRLAAGDKKYTAAADRFDLRASALSEKIEALRAQLQGLQGE